MSKKSKSHLHNVAMFPLSSPILLVCVWARYVMRYPGGSKKGMQFLILSSPVRLNSDNPVIKQAFNKLLKFNEVCGDLRFMSKQVNPSEFTIIINETDIVFFDQKNQSQDPKHLNKQAPKERRRNLMKLSKVTDEP
jgi:hypothetical protein